MPLQMAAEKGNTPEEGDAAAAAVAADGQFYFATRVSDKPNVKMFFELVRNQLLLGASCYWTLSVIDPTSDPTFFATTTFDFSLIPLLLGVVASAPLVAGGFAISRSESRTWVDINSATNQLALRLFGGKKALVTVGVSSSVLGILTAAAEELSFRGLGMPLTADRLGLDMSSPSGLAGVLLISSLVFGLGHWSWGGAFRDNLVTSALQTCTGLYLGLTYILAGGNLVVPGMVHAIYDAFTLLEAHVSTVSQIEYAKANAEVSKEQPVEAELDAAFVDNARSIFWLADTTRDAKLNIAEVRAAILSLGTLLTEDRLSELFATADADADALLDLGEFFTFVALLKKEKVQNAPEQSSLLW